MGLNLIEGPDLEPITLAEAKLQCKVDTTDDDALFAIWIAGARKTAEHLTGRAFVEQAWELTLDDFPRRCSTRRGRWVRQGEIELAKPNVLAIVSIKYDDTNGDEQTLAADQYVLDAATMPGWVFPVGDWPETASDAVNTVRVRFTAGYGDAASDVPACIREWMLLQVGAAHRNREAFVAGISVAALPNRFVDGLLDSELTYL